MTIKKESITELQNYTYNEHIKKLARALPKETQFKVTDVFRHSRAEQTFDELADECGVTVQELCGVLLLNIKDNSNS